MHLMLDITCPFSTSFCFKLPSLYSNLFSVGLVETKRLQSELATVIERVEEVSHRSTMTDTGRRALARMEMGLHLVHDHLQIQRLSYGRGPGRLITGDTTGLHPPVPYTLAGPSRGILAAGDAEAFGPSLGEDVASLQHEVALAERSLFHDVGGQAGEIQALLQPVKRTTEILDRIKRLSSHSTDPTHPRASAP